MAGRDLRRWDENALLAGEWCRPSSIEEEGDVRVFLGLGDAQLAQPRAPHRLAEGVGEILGREECRQEGLEIARIFGHAGRCGETHGARAPEARESRIQ